MVLSICVECENWTIRFGTGKYADNYACLSKFVEMYNEDTDSADYPFFKTVRGQVLFKKRINGLGIELHIPAGVCDVLVQINDFYKRARELEDQAYEEK